MLFEASNIRLYLLQGQNAAAASRVYPEKPGWDDQEWQSFIKNSLPDGVTAVPIITGRSLVIEAAEKVGVVGPSGSGKSLTFQSIFGLLHPVLEPFIFSAGLKFRGEPVRLDTLRPRLGREICFLFQEAGQAFHPDFTLRRQFSGFLKRHAVETARHAELMHTWLDLTGLPHEKLDSKPGGLSGGMLQRFSIAMGLSLKPALVVADECTSALDVTTQAVILELLDKLCSREETALFFISHDMDVIREYTTRQIHCEAAR